MAQGISERVERRAKGAGFSEEERRKLAGLFDSLKSETSELSKTNREKAHNIAGFARVASKEAARAEPNVRRLKLAIENLKTAVEEFEASHPRLVQTVATIITILAGMGI